jgi:hypothetical protein
LLSVMQLVLLVLCLLSALVACVSSLCFTRLERVLFWRLERNVDEDKTKHLTTIVPVFAIVPLF